MNSIKFTRSKPHDNKPRKILHPFIRAFIIHDSCINTIDQIVRVMHEYHLIDFGDNGEIRIKTVKFINANQTTNTLKIIVMDLKTDEVIQRSKNINDEVDDWQLTDIYTSDKDVICDYCENDDTHNDELLEFDF